jgi:hypothetical protein
MKIPAQLLFAIYTGHKVAYVKHGIIYTLYIEAGKFIKEVETPQAFPGKAFSSLYIEETVHSKFELPKFMWGNKNNR